MSDGFAALFWGILTFSVLIVIHEGGHFLTARAFGVKVHEFMIGLPGPAVRFAGPKTTYGVTAIPLGGYVRIAGMEPGPEDPLLGPVLAAVTRRENANAFEVATDLGIDEAQADAVLLTLADWYAIEPIEGDRYRYRSRFTAQQAHDESALLDAARAQTYRALPTWKRLIVLSSGVVMNLLAAVLVFTVVLSVWGYYPETGAIATVAKGSSAEQAGLVPGDKIVAIDSAKIGNWQTLIMTLGSHQVGETVTVTYIRNGESATTQATLGAKPDNGGALLGVGPETKHVILSPLRAFVVSFGFIGLTFQAILGYFDPDTFRVSIQHSSSVIGAAYMAADAAKSSALDYAGLFAMLSLALGVINIIPIPPLDGGKVAIEVIERLAGKPIPKNLSLGLSVGGALLLFTLIGYLMYSDVMRYIIG